MTSASASAASRLDQRLAAAREGRAYRNYLAVREDVLAMLERRDGGESNASAYWREELANIEYLLDASPLVVEGLRQHSYHVTGVWPYHYRTHKDQVERRHRLKLRHR